MKTIIYYIGEAVKTLIALTVFVIPIAISIALAVIFSPWWFILTFALFIAELALVFYIQDSEDE